MNGFDAAGTHAPAELPAFVAQDFVVVLEPLDPGEDGAEMIVLVDLVALQRQA